MKLERGLRRSAITLVIADANVMAGRLLSHQFRRFSDFAVVSVCVDRASLLKSVRKTKTEVALISADLQDGHLTGLAAVREVREADRTLRPILLFDRPDSQLVVESLRAGARGVFSRTDFDFAALRKCVRRVYEGQIWIGNEEMEWVVDALSQLRPLRVVSPDRSNLLSRREQDVMRLVAEGLGNREIAQSLELSEHTVKNYMFHIFDKLGISNRVELVLYAVSKPNVVAAIIPEKQKSVSDRNPQ